MRLVFWLVIALTLLWLFRSRKAIQRSDTLHRQGSLGSEAMVQCRQCRVHFPASEALTDGGGRLFCCEDHRIRHRAN